MRNKKGLSLIELIAVIVIISIAFFVGGIATTKVLEKQKTKILSTEIRSIKANAISYAAAKILPAGETTINLLSNNDMTNYYKITVDPWGNPYEQAKIVFAKVDNNLSIDVYLMVRNKGCYKLFDDQNTILLGATCEPPPPPPPPPPPTYVAAESLTDSTPYAYYYVNTTTIAVYNKKGDFIKNLPLPAGHNNFGFSSQGIVSPSGDFYTITMKDLPANPNTYIVKYAKNGSAPKIIWSGYAPGWPAGPVEMPWFVQEAIAFNSDGSYYIGFFGRSGPVKSYLKKYNSNDILQWSVQVGQTYSDMETRYVWLDWEDTSKVYTSRNGGSFAYSNGYIKVMNATNGSLLSEIPKNNIAIINDPYRDNWFIYKGSTGTTVVDGITCTGRGFIKVNKTDLTAIEFVAEYNGLTQLHPFDEYGYTLMMKPDQTEQIPDGEGGYYSSVVSNKYEHVDLYGRKIYKVDYNIPVNRGTLIDIYSGR